MKMDDLILSEVFETETCAHNKAVFDHCKVCHSLLWGAPRVPAGMMQVGNRYYKNSFEKHGDPNYSSKTATWSAVGGNTVSLKSFIEYRIKPAAKPKPYYIRYDKRLEKTHKWRLGGLISEIGYEQLAFAPGYRDGQNKVCVFQNNKCVLTVHITGLDSLAG
jgi:hypothetical protein